MRVPRVDLDYARRSNRAAWARFALMVIALAFAGDVAVRYTQLQDDVASLEATIARHGRSLPVAHARPVSASVSDEEWQAARETIGRIATPWDELFLAIESAHTDGAFLLAIEPKVESRSVLLSGEARDYLRLLSYIAALSDVARLEKVHLVRHELKANDPQRPLAFVISAHWSNAR